MTLTAPVIMLDYKTADDFGNKVYSLNWLPIAGATSYQIFANNVYAASTSAPTIKISPNNHYIGTNSRRMIQVKAVNTMTKEESELSNPVYPPEPPAPILPPNWSLADIKTTSATINISGNYNPNSNMNYSSVQGGNLPVEIELYTARWNGTYYIPDELIATKPYVLGTSLSFVVSLPDCQTSYVFITSKNVYEGNKNATITRNASLASIQTRPIPPERIIAERVGQKDIKITWTASPSANKNPITYSLFDNDNEVIPHTILRQSQSWILKNLPVGPHAFSVKACWHSLREESVFTFSEMSLSASTLVLPDAPTIPSASNRTTTSVLLSWKEASNVHGYNIYNGTTKLNNTIIPKTSFSVKDLLPGTLYSALCIKAIYETTESEPVSFGSVYTLPAQPSNAILVGTTQNYASISWTPARGNVVGYNVYNGGTKLNTTLLGPTETKFSMLTIPNTKYKNVVIRAVNEAGDESTPALVSEFRTPIAAPIIVAVSDISETTCKIDWTIDGMTSGFKIFDDKKILCSASTKQTSILVSGLTPNTKYSCINMKSIDADGELSASSENATPFCTLALPPTPHCNPIKNRLTSSVVLQWTNSPHASGYNIYIDGEKKNLYLIKTSPCIITDLQPNTFYKNIVIRPVNVAGEENISKSLSLPSFWTLANAPVAPSTQTVKGTVTLSWELPEGGAAGFLLKKGTITLKTTPPELTPTTTSCEVVGLSKNMTHVDISVVSLNGNSPKDETSTSIIPFFVK